MKRRVVALAWMGAVLLGAPWPLGAEAPLTISPVVVSGDRAPGGGTFGKFQERPMLTDAGATIFVATVRGGATALGIFLTSGGAITKVAAQGDATPIGGTFQNFKLGRPSPTPSGKVVFVAAVAGGKASKAIFLVSQGAIRKVVALGDPTPIGGTFDDIDERPSVNDDETVVLTASIKGGPSSGGVFLFAKGALTKLVAEGDPAPIGGKFARSYSRPTINARGAAVVSASIDGGPAPHGVFLAVGGALTPVVRSGDPAPATGGARFVRFQDADLNERDEIPFRAQLEGGAAAEGFFVASQGRIVKVVASGDSLPSGEKLDAPAGRPSANGRGAVAFLARLKDGVGIFLASNGAVTKVVTQDDPTPVGGTFGRLFPPSLTDSGAIVFRASVVGSRVSEGVFMAKRP